MITCFARLEGGDRCTKAAVEGSNYCSAHRDLFLATHGREQLQMQQQQQQQRDGIQVQQQQQQQQQ